MLMFPAAFLASNDVVRQKSNEVISKPLDPEGLLDQGLSNTPLIGAEATSPFVNQAVSVQETLATTAPALNTQDQLIQVSLSLVAVLIVIYALAWLIKRNRGVQGLASLPIKTLAVLPMGVKEKIVLIEVGGKQILLGLTAHNINTLASFDEPILVVKDKNPKSFSDRLKDIMNQVKQDSAQASFQRDDKEKKDSSSNSGSETSS
jgi:flagellar protein FliO/FliZ